MNRKANSTILIFTLIMFFSCSKEEDHLLSGVYEGETTFEGFNHFTNEELYSKLDHTTTFTDEGIVIIDYFQVDTQDTSEWFLNEDTNTLIFLKRASWTGGDQYKLLNFDKDSIVYTGRVRRSIDGQSFLFDQKTTLIKQ